MTKTNVNHYSILHYNICYINICKTSVAEYAVFKQLVQRLVTKWSNNYMFIMPKYIYICNLSRRSHLNNIIIMSNIIRMPVYIICLIVIKASVKVPHNVFLFSINKRRNSSQNTHSMYSLSCFVWRTLLLTTQFRVMFDRNTSAEQPRSLFTLRFYLHFSSWVY